MYNPLAVANEFLSLALKEKKPITPMQLLKLVYFAHGWHLATGTPLIDEGIQAWKFGPVVPSLYQTFKIYRDQPISGLGTEISPHLNEAISPRIPENDIWTTKFLEQIWKTYGHMSGAELSALTHEKNSPWHKAWVEGDGLNWNKTIPNDSIEEYFCKKIDPAKRSELMSR